MRRPGRGGLAAVLLAGCGAAAFGRLDRARQLEQSDEDCGVGDEGCIVCTDTHDNCGMWAGMGECTANVGYMKANCAKSCNQCPSKPYLSREQRAKCTDTHPTCKSWTHKGQCDKDPAVAEKCPQSCFGCQSLSCWDAHPECGDWARNGACRNNSDYMFEECKYSCRMCGVNFKAECRRHKEMPAMAVPGTVDETFEAVLSNFPQFKPTVLHRDPWVLHFDSFLTSEEADHLVSTASARFERSLAGEGVTPVRTSATSWCNVDSCLRDLRFQEIRQRIANLTRVPWENAEHLQVLRYEPGQFYKEHHDQNAPKNSAWGPRLYTFFMYLSDVERGGETRFTRLNISVAPKKGTAILWPSVLNDDPWSTDQRTFHEAVAVLQGVKLSANFWIHMFEFQKALGRGCENVDYYQDVSAPATSEGSSPQPRRH